MSNAQFLFPFKVTSQILKSNFPLGLDLKSKDIQRSRDHGLASYNDMREYCGLSKAKNFSDFNDVILQMVRKLLFSFTARNCYLCPIMHFLGFA